MSEASWLGYSPLTAEAEAWLVRLWRQHGLPREPSFRHWSMEYARQVYEAIQALAKEGDVGLEVLPGLLASMDVWSENPKDQQWVPADWTPPEVADPA